MRKNKVNKHILSILLLNIEKDDSKTKLYDLKRAEELLEKFEDWICEEKWNYEISYKEFMTKVDPDLKLFMNLL